MNQADKEMRYLIEQAGGCWHEPTGINAVWKHECRHCGILWDSMIDADEFNPNPNSVDALLKIAKTLKLVITIKLRASGDWYVRVVNSTDMLRQRTHAEIADELADALRAALYQATGGK